MTQYFIKEWHGKEIKAVHECCTVELLFKKLGELKHKDISIYEAHCLLDWS